MSEPRVLADEYGIEWKFDSGLFWRRSNRAAWSPADEDAAAVTADRVRLWADLLGHPFDEEPA